MPKCFVIQPFDRGKFDKRYDDVFAPAIKDAGLEAYRVDRDPSVSIPVEDIEKQIRDSDICLADISLNNPNVWYEVGYALACGKEVVLTCCRTDRTEERFPFDIQHRKIIIYVSESVSDFKRLQEQIAAQLQRRLEKHQEIQALVTIGGALKADGPMLHEIAILVAISGETISNVESVSVNILRHSLEQAGFTSGALGLGIRRLARMGFVLQQKCTDPEDGSCYAAVQLTKRGEDWLMINLDKVPLRRNARKNSGASSDTEFAADDIPF